MVFWLTFILSVYRILVQTEVINMDLRLPSLFERIRSKAVFVIGDFYLDEQVNGRITGMSADGPFPRIAVESRLYQPSAAGHVAVLLNEWGVRVKVAGLIGDDPAGIALRQAFDNRGIDSELLLAINEKVTCGRTRILAQGDHYPLQEILQFDLPASEKPAAAICTRLSSAIESALPKFDVLVMVEKEGLWLTASQLQKLTRTAKKHGIHLIGDSERQLHLFKGFDAVTPNDRELLAAVPGESDLVSAAQRLQKQLNCAAIYVSLGNKGIQLVSRDAAPLHIPTLAQSVFDVTGAGETVVAATTVGCLAGLQPQETAQLINRLAGLAVKRPGLAPLSLQSILQSERQEQAREQANKIVSLSQLNSIVREAQSQGKRVVWTNGCYDLVHAGHILYLEKARALGDLLVLGLNSDASVRLSKGANRPIVNQEQRAQLMSALSCVDFVIIFDDQSPVKIIGQLKPDIYAKGGDYSIDTINQDERSLVESYGGRIMLLPGVEGMSTTHLIEKILANYRGKSSPPGGQD